MASGDETAGDEGLLIPGGSDWRREDGRDGGASTRGKDASQCVSGSPFANLHRCRPFSSAWLRLGHEECNMYLHVTKISRYWRDF